MDCGPETVRHNRRAMHLFNLLSSRQSLRAALAAAVLACVGWAAIGAAQAQPRLIHEAVAVDNQGQAERFPSSAPSRLVNLPDDWSNSRARENSAVWYRVKFDRPTGPAGDRVGVYIERACSNAVVIVNGEVMHQEGRLDGNVSRRCRMPVLVQLPQALLRNTGNDLDIKVAGYTIQEVGSDDRAGWLSAIEVGNHAELQKKAKRKQLLQFDIPRISTFALALLGAALLLLGRTSQRESHLIYYGLALILAGLLPIRQWWADVPMSNYLLEIATLAALPLVALSAIQFFLRYAGWRSRPIDVALIAQCIIVPASVLLAGPWRMHTLTSSWLVLLTTQIIVAIAIYLWTMWHRDRRDFFFMLLVTGFGLTSLVMLIMLQQDRTAPVPEAWAQHGLTAMLVLLGLRLIQQFGRELQVSEASRRSTEMRVRDATLEIEKNFAQLAELRVEQVTAQERKRIAGDLHDDLGAKLLTIVHTSNDERISSLAREALEEMRLSVRGLTGKPVKLVDALGDWRAEFVQRLSQTGLEADWESPGDDEMPQTLSARAYVQTTRILREAVNNIIKHAGASRCAVNVKLTGSDFELAIQDNGKGIAMVIDGKLDRGHGMASMKHRAKQLHGQCLVESAPGYGTVIRLTLPLDRHVEPT